MAAIPVSFMLQHKHPFASSNTSSESALVGSSVETPIVLAECEGGQGRSYIGYELANLQYPVLGCGQISEQVLSVRGFAHCCISKIIHDDRYFISMIF